MRAGSIHAIKTWASFGAGYIPYAGTSLSIFDALRETISGFTSSNVARNVGIDYLFRCIEKMLGQTEDQAQREQRFRLLASFGWKVTKAAVAMVDREMRAMVLRFPADFLLLPQSRFREVALYRELYLSHSVLRA